MLWSILNRIRSATQILVVLKLGEHNEDYIFSLPTAYGRSILTVPWFELGGTVSVECPQSGYSASIRFHTKVKHKISILF